MEAVKTAQSRTATAKLEQSILIDCTWSGYRLERRILSNSHSPRRFGLLRQNQVQFANRRIANESHGRPTGSLRGWHATGIIDFSTEVARLKATRQAAESRIAASSNYAMIPGGFWRSVFCIRTHTTDISSDCMLGSGSTIVSHGQNESNALGSRCVSMRNSGVPPRISN